MGAIKGKIKRKGKGKRKIMDIEENDAHTKSSSINLSQKDLNSKEYFRLKYSQRLYKFKSQTVLTIEMIIL